MSDEGIELNNDDALCVESENESDIIGDEEFEDEVNLETDAFLVGYDVLKIPVVDACGEPVWPERFPLWKIEKLKKTVGINKFSAQMLLEPVDLNRGRFDVNRLKFYDAELERVQRNGMFTYSIGGVPVVSYGCWWDPAFGSIGGDGSVISVVFVSEDGRYFLHDLEYLHYATGDGEKSAEEQCRAVAKFLSRNFVSRVYVESNGIGKFLPEFLQNMLDKTGVKCQVVAESSSISKVIRITSAFDAVVSAGCLNVREKFRTSEFMAEFKEWNVDSRGHDDGMDSVGGAISVEKSKLPMRNYGNEGFPIRKMQMGKIRLGALDF